MRVPRLHVPQALVPGTELELDPRAARHCATVLRLRAGAPVILFDGEGTEAAGRLVLVGRGTARVQVEALRDPLPEPALALHLVMGLARGERMDWVIQKAVELGVHSITPVITERSVVRLREDNRRRRMDHWRGVLVGACEQCGRARLPALHEPLALADYLAQPARGLRLVLSPAGETGPHRLQAAHAAELLIGPEGGLAPHEHEAAAAAGFTALRLGPRILRTETAAVAALACLQVLWGDMGAGG